MASIRASNIRLDDTFGGDIERETRRVALEATSSYVYDYAIGHKGLDFLTQMLSGLVSTLDKRYSEALGKIESIKIENVPERLRPLVLVDLAWCQVNLGQRETGWRVAIEIPTLLHSVKEDDDLAYIHSRLAQIGQACDESRFAESESKLAVEALSRHRQFQAALLSKLQAINTAGEWKSPAKAGL